MKLVSMIGLTKELLSDYSQVSSMASMARYGVTEKRDNTDLYLITSTEFSENDHRKIVSLLADYRQIQVFKYLDNLDFLCQRETTAWAVDFVFQCNHQGCDITHQENNLAFNLSKFYSFDFNEFMDSYVEYGLDSAFYGVVCPTSFLLANRSSQIVSLTGSISERVGKARLMKGRAQEAVAMMFEESWCLGKASIAAPLWREFYRFPMFTIEDFTSLLFTTVVESKINDALHDSNERNAKIWLLADHPVLLEILVGFLFNRLNTSLDQIVLPQLELGFNPLLIQFACFFNADKARLFYLRADFSLGFYGSHSEDGNEN